MMTQQQELDKELYRLLKEQSADPRTFAGVAARLQAELESPVPMRPAFKADLRARLMTEAAGRRPTLWFQRPAVLSALGGAAAVVVLAVGLHLFTGSGGKTLPPTTGPGQTQPGPSGGLAHFFNKTALPAVVVADERRSGQPIPGGGLEGAKELPTYTLTGQVTADLTQGIAQRLAFQNPTPVASGDRFQVTEGARSLEVTKTGELLYEDKNAANSDSGVAVQAGSTLTGGQAVQVANQFLQQALLPVVDASPAVAEADQAFLVSYQDRFQGRPVVGGDTQVWVSRSGGVRRLQSVTPSGQEQASSYSVVTYADAVKQAEIGGGRFDRGDLVWVRTPVEQKVYLQPYWRLFGHDESGPIIRYVPALQR
jgi:hypothetical protein